MNQIDIHGQKKFKIDTEILHKVLNDSLNIFQLDDTLIELNFISKTDIQKLNKKFRHIDKPTDVLSFPQITLPKFKIRILGDIVISPQIVEKKGERLSEVIKHGLLHLLGYDHDTDEKKWQEAAHKIDCEY